MWSSGKAVINVRRPRAMDPAAIKRTGAPSASIVIVLGFPAGGILKRRRRESQMVFGSLATAQDAPYPSLSSPTAPGTCEMGSKGRRMKRMNRGIAVVIAAALLIGAASVSAWEESDFPPRPLAAYSFTPSGPEPSTVIGEPRSYTFAKGDTLYDVARHLGLGINEVTEAFPDLDVWLPPEGETLAFPTWWVLPDSSYEGVVVNIPEMRLYYFPPHLKGGLRTAITYPVGLGRDEWRTPTGKFKVTEKTVNPKWVVPESIRAEHIRDRGDDRNMIPGGAPDNPLGHYRIRLSLPLYGIHGTNIPWGVGMEVSHG